LYPHESKGKILETEAKITLKSKTRVKITLEQYTSLLKVRKLTLSITLFLIIFYIEYQVELLTIKINFYEFI